MFRRIGIWVDVILKLLLSFRKSKANILNAKETIQFVLHNRKSVIRLGDGEFGLFHDRDIHYQVYSKELKERINQIIKRYECNSDLAPYLLCVPYKFFKTNGFFLMKKRVYVSSWAISKYDFLKNFRQDIVYGDAFLFALNNSDIYPSIWAETDNIIFVHNNVEYAQAFKKTSGKNVYFVKVPSKNAFSFLVEIEENIICVFGKDQITKENSVILISAGPAGKVIAFDFCLKGYWCIDVGHCWDDPLEIQ